MSADRSGLYGDNNVPDRRVHSLLAIGKKKQPRPRASRRSEGRTLQGKLVQDPETLLWREEVPQ